MKPALSVITQIKILPVDIHSALAKCRKRLVIAANVAWAITASSCHATFVVSILNQDRIVVAADSLWNGTDGRAASSCKIQIPQPDCVFAIVGLVSKGGTNFNSISIASRACSAERSPTKRAEAFGRIAFPEVEAAMAYSRKNSPDTYRQKYEGRDVVTAIFVGFEENTPIIAVQSLSLTADGKTEDQFTRLFYRKDGQDQVYAHGGRTHAKRDGFINTHPNWDSIDAAELARIFVDLQIAETPDEVGPPVSILEVKNGGTTRWIAPGKCGDDKERVNIQPTRP